MLIRFILENIHSYGDQKEFTMVPNNKLRTLNHHKYEVNDIEVLKIASIYGANASGKSNLVKALLSLVQLVRQQSSLYEIVSSKFKLDDEYGTKPQILAVEFIEKEHSFYYAIEITDNFISREELYSTTAKSEQLIFERKSNHLKESSLKFSDEFDLTDTSKVLKSVLLNDFLESNQPIFPLLAKRENEYFDTLKLAYNWFINTVEIINPDTVPRGLAHSIDIDSSFKNFAEEILCSFDLGIKSVKSKKTSLDKYFKNVDSSFKNDLLSQLNESNSNMLFKNDRTEQVIITKENNEAIVKELKLEHLSKSGSPVSMNLSEESDGTRRLIEFLPAFKALTSANSVIIIDEIERSIHPLLIKEIITKYSLDENTSGQLIFTTHESNLLDQNIFRLDEIWFTEKDKHGQSDLYSLSDFKEHKTIDIRKGYLNGRYGSIPFLGNLKNMNWKKHDNQQTSLFS